MFISVLCWISPLILYVNGGLKYDTQEKIIHLTENKASIPGCLEKMSILCVQCILFL